MTIWHPPTPHPPANCTPTQWEWLISASSLTERLRQLSNHHTTMQLLYAGWGKALNEEQELLAQFSREEARRFWLREIMHVYQQPAPSTGSLFYTIPQAWIWGRVVIPEGSLRKIDLDGKSPQPIGDILFADSRLRRTQLSLAQLPSSHFYHRKIAAYLPDTLKPVWTRRSILWFRQQPLFVTEIFLPSFFDYADNHRVLALNAL